MSEEPLLGISSSHCPFMGSSVVPTPPGSKEVAPAAAQQLLAAWQPLLSRMNAGCSAPPAYEHLAAASNTVTDVARRLVKDRSLRMEIGSAPSIWPSLQSAFVYSRNHLFCVFGYGKQGVACANRAERAVELAAAHFFLVRNLCAEVSANQRNAWERELYVTAEEIMSYLCSWLASTKDCCSHMKEKVARCVNMGTQMLANMMTGNPEVQDAMWPHYFKADSELLSQLLSTCDSNRIIYTLICIHNCMHKCRQRCNYLIDTSTGTGILKCLLTKAARMMKEESEALQAFDFIYAIFSNMIELDMTPQILKAICFATDPARRHILTQHHITFLHLLDGMMEAQYSRVASTSAPPPIELSIDSTIFLVAVASRVVRHLNKIEQDLCEGILSVEELMKSVIQPDMADGPIPGKCLLERDMNGVALMVKIFARVTQEMGPDAKVKLVRAGLAETLLGLLVLVSKLQPRSTLKGQQTPATGFTPCSVPTSSPTPPPEDPSATTPYTPTSGSSIAENPLCPSESGCPDLPSPTKTALFGVKTEAVKVLSNLAYEAVEVQDEIRRIGGMPIILSLCQIDDYNPFIKEQAIFCIRNLCDGNLANQELVASLQPMGISPESASVLKQNGLSARVDATTGKVKVGPNVPAPASPSASSYTSSAASLPETMHPATGTGNVDRMDSDDIDALRQHSGVQFQEVEM
ncbi:spinocerebellar ataxia type 10 protein domain-containing protein [Phlyctochytrium arcticum]|nr:spinocerebellar ataxia type 10 protein domain-containing protein [Phlyctochytrium arcticum]